MQEVHFDTYPDKLVLVEPFDTWFGQWLVGSTAVLAFSKVLKAGAFGPKLL